MKEQNASLGFFQGLEGHQAPDASNPLLLLRRVCACFLVVIGVDQPAAHARRYSSARGACLTISPGTKVTCPTETASWRDIVDQERSDASAACSHVRAPATIPAEEASSVRVGLSSPRSATSAPVDGGSFLVDEGRLGPPHVAVLRDAERERCGCSGSHASQNEREGRQDRKLVPMKARDSV